ncbi:hypothetical protein Liucustia_114 [Acinetobacter phage Liucustia]|uniref:Uncharacterized protein n=1 Tax=Acinetobacter phage vB_AbaM_B09_Aci02-2 TaxID=2315467 RepID=A0A386KN21_9CAUD|nr:hypothetical protein HOU30_gp071 [Acinetobacter phage vB_AbaM_B09_Aci02-2]AYD85831.1 hypothetical protein Aci022_119 [Acinetobacter phage vB_AbaM_B09_Aci02-2]QQV88814.1 hypothetical protein Liucustia_114 [Acinetobacter phage Liucustia]
MSLFTVGNDVGLAADHLNFAIETLEDCDIDGEAMDSLRKAQQRLDQAMAEIADLRVKYGET